MVFFSDLTGFRPCRFANAKSSCFSRCFSSCFRDLSSGRESSFRKLSPYPEIHLLVEARRELAAVRRCRGCSCSCCCCTGGSAALVDLPSLSLFSQLAWLYRKTKERNAVDKQVTKEKGIANDGARGMALTLQFLSKGQFENDSHLNRCIPHTVSATLRF